jgi:FkbM family methyltransferase
MTDYLKRIGRAIMRRTGYTITKRRTVPVQQNPLTLGPALARVAQHIEPPQTIIDIGASNGSWTVQAMEQFPDAQYLLIEANPVHEPALMDFTAQHPAARYVLVAAGDRAGTIYFDAHDPFGGAASHTAREGYREVPVITVDAAVAQHGLKGPYVLKLDTHGFEVPILEGARQTLTDTALVIMECYNFRIQPDSLLFDEMCQHMAGLGFRPVDLCDPLFRPIDGALWQMDLFFIRADHALFGRNTYE